MQQIIKRDGTKQCFDKMKIVDAILAAFKEVDKEITDYALIKSGNIADYIAEIAETRELTIEEIQDLVEKGLMSTKRKDVAKAFILYREQRTKERNRHSQMVTTMKEKLFASNVQNQNANVDEKSFGGKMGEMADALAKQYALDYLLSPIAKANHLNNEVYIHDLGHYALGDHNCLSIPFDPLLEKGFNTRQADVRGANTVSTAFQLIAVLKQLQSLQQFGGVSATHLDWTLVPYVRKSFFKHYIVAYLKTTPDFLVLDLTGMLFDNYEDEVGVVRNKFDDWVDEHKQKFLTKFNLTLEDFRFDNKEKLDPFLYQSALYDTIVETKQAAEGLYHNLNTLQSRSGNQLPFTSINYGTCTSPEGRLVIKCLLEGSLAGVGKVHKTSVFPCSIFQCMEGVNRKPGDPNYDLYRLALKSTARRLYPNYANVDWSGNAGYDRNDPRTYFSTMGCRTANGWDINGFGQLKDGRGNICPVTIILPTLAMQAKTDKYEDFPHCNYEESIVASFINLLNTKIEEAKDMLIERFEYICSQSPDSAKFMYENNTMAGYIPEEGIRSALKHGTLAIGQLGLAEALQILIGCDHTTYEGMELAKKIESLFKRKAAEFKEEYQLNFGVYYTPKSFGLGVA